MRFEKTLLVTGAAGFIGRNFIEYFSKRYPNVRLVDLDKMTYAAHEAAVTWQRAQPNIEVEVGDICDATLVACLFERYHFDGVVHFAAESHVDNSIRDPGRFVRTNVLGTQTLLDVARHYWLVRENRRGAVRFHHVSTDEVYGSLGETGFFKETTPYAPNSPYSASKRASDHLVRAYGETYGLPYTLSNCSNNYGPWQHAEKLIPTVIRKALRGEAIPIYGNGRNVRDWLWVGDHCRAIDMIYHHGENARSYNVGGSCERDNLSLVRDVCAILDRLAPRQSGGSYVEQIEFVTDRPGHDFRYAIDSTRLQTELGWSPQMSLQEGLRRTVRWYLDRSGS